MVAVNPLVALAAVMLAFLVAIIAGILLFRDWYDYEPTLPRDTEGAVEQLIESPVAWTVAFLGGAALFGGSTYFWLSASPEAQSTYSTVAVALIAVLVAVFTFVGVWEVVRSRGRANAEAVGMGAIAVGLLFVAAIAAQLLLS